MPLHHASQSRNPAIAHQRNPLMMFEKNQPNDNHNYRHQKHKK